MTWEQRFGALVALTAMNGMQRTSGWSRNGWPPTRQHSSRSRYRAAGGGRMPRRGRSGLATRHSSKPTSTTGTRAGRLRQTLSLAKSHPDCPISRADDGRLRVSGQRNRAHANVSEANRTDRSQQASQLSTWAAAIF